MIWMKRQLLGLTAAVGLLAMTTPLATAAAACDDLPGDAALTDALRDAIAPTGGPTNGGLETHMWATLVDRSGTVCAVTRSGDSPGDQWPGSRAISAQKANTANSFSLPTLALSTANLWAATQPGGSLYGLQHSNPVNTEAAYKGSFKTYGTAEDPLVGSKIGGVNVFGGGLALYTDEGDLIGALGVSGNTSCADHNIAWRVRSALGLANVPAGVSPDNNDAVIYDVNEDDDSASGFGHPQCGNSEHEVASQIGAGVNP
mgnify:CR=1 FL=1